MAVLLVQVAQPDSILLGQVNSHLSTFNYSWDTPMASETAVAPEVIATPQVSVVIPVYNEEATLERIVERVLTLQEVLEVIIIDDNSSDATVPIAQRLARTHSRVKLARHSQNLGKTRALKTGFALTRGEIVIIQDADLEYDPAEIPFIIDPILSKQADVVYGSRFLVRRAARVLYFYHYLANKLLTFISNAFTNLNMTDVQTGYKAFRGEIIRNMIIRSRGFGFEIEATAKIAKLGCAVYEVPISYYGRTYSEGKKIGFRDGLYALWLLFRFNLLCSRRSSFHRLPKAARAEESDYLERESYG